MDLEFSRMDSPIGKIEIFVRDGALVALGFEKRRAPLLRTLERRFGNVKLVRKDGRSDITARLREYFRGDATALNRVPVDLGGTPFQRKVWDALRRIPAGRTVSYSDIARAIGRPRAVRAVGTANANNPVSLVIPCHRVIGSDGRLHGYGGGLERKQWLLDHEMKSRTA